MLDPDFDTHRLLVRLLSAQLARGDLVEAVYQGEDPTFAGYVGLSAVWVVVGERSETALLVPHSVLVDAARRGAIGSAPLTDFHKATKLAKTPSAGSEPPSGPT